MSNEDYLMHYGVLGMKWGVRKKSAASSGSSGSKKKKQKKSVTETVKEAVANEIEQDKEAARIVKEKTQEVISSVDKEKVAHVAKTVAITTGKIAVAVTLGSLGTLAMSEIQSGMSKYKASQKEQEQQQNFQKWQKKVERNQEAIKTEILPDDPLKKK